MKYLDIIITFLVIFIIVYIIDYYFINKKRLYKKKKNKKNKTIGELDYLITRFKLNKKKLDLDKVIRVIAIINSFIIAITSCIVLLLPVNKIWTFLFAFVLLFSLIYALYEIYGNHLKKVEERK